LVQVHYLQNPKTPLIKYYGRLIERVSGIQGTD